ncbi:T9SS type A sorting domain-containing protein [Hymenobacter sp. ASUV-10]|uniref:T9SS type A sorting domain-containing protein n=1 Tax=Hymenobacter aranciens TaxID=3063996 RepID=A0ABT9BF49_9BACT|nr:T9SS type A sorting domain-containing protein [Hymenobacter sp. ASUV-10]MDO7876903.1 T9SS type A sorting domain-containing protein [Hymenobacter sp. ASUV-10]
MQQLLPTVQRWAGAGKRWLGLLLLLSSSAAWAQTNDDCAQAVPVAVSANCAIPVNGSVAGATQSVAPTTGCGFNVTAANDVWYSFVATGASQLITLAPRFAAIMDIRSGDCAATTSVFCAQVFQGNTNPTTVPGLTVGQSYLLRVYATAATPPAGINSTFALCIAPGASTAVPVNDDCAGAIDVPVQANGMCGALTVGDNTGAGASAGVPVPGCGQYVGGDIWFKVTVPASGSVTVQTVAPASGSPINDTGLAVYSGSCANLSLVGCDDDGGGGTGYSLYTATGRTPGEVLYVRVWEFGGNVVGPIGLCARTPLAPANDECAGARPLLVSATCNPMGGSLENATQSLAPTTGCGTLATVTDVWYSFVATGATQLLTTTANFQLAVDVRAGTCASSTSVYCAVGFGNQPRIISGLTAGQPYYLRVYASGQQPTGANSGFTLCLGPPPVGPANDNCAQAVPLAVGATCGTPTAGTVANASQSLAAVTGCGNVATANDVWYSFVANGATQNLAFTGLFVAVLEVRSGTCASSSSVSCTTVFNNQTAVLTGLTSGQTYFLRLYANSAATPPTPTFTVCLSTGPTPPTNDECAGAIALPVSSTCANPTAGTYLTVGQSLPPTTGCGNVTIARDVWYAFVATGATQTVNLASTFGGVVDVRSGSCASSSSVFCGTVFTNTPLVVTGLSTGQAYYLRLYPSTNIQPTGTQANFTICLTAGPVAAANDECATAVPVPVVQSCATSTNGTVAGATQSLPGTAGCGGGTAAANDVWYSFVAAAPAQLITLTSRFAAVLEVRSGTCASSSSVFCNFIQANAATGTVAGGLTTGQTYYIRIYSGTNNPPTTANSTFTLCINPAPTPPANDECAQAVPVPVTTSCASPVSGTVEAASQSLSPSANCGNAVLAQDVWYRFVASGVTQLVTLNARFMAVLDVRTGPCGGGGSLVCTAMNMTPNNTVLVGGLTVGNTYYMRVYSSSNVQPAPLNATFTLCVQPGPVPPANDECAAAVPLAVGATCTPTAGTLANATQSLAPSSTCVGGNGNAPDVWYSFVAGGTSQNVTVEARLAATVEVLSGTCGTLSTIFCNLQRSPTPVTHLVGGLTAGQTYYVRVYGVDLAPPTGAQAAITICVTPAPPAPANDNCAGAIEVPVQYGSTCTSPATGSNLGATASPGVPAPGCAVYTGGDIWFKTTVPASGTLTVQTVLAATNDVGDTGLAVYAGTCASLSLVNCNDDGGGNLKSLLQLTGRTPGEVLYIRVWSLNNRTTGNLAVCVTSPMPTCADPTALTTANITPGGADLSWTPGGTPPTGATYTVVYGPQGFDPLTAGTYIVGLISPTVTLASLTPGTNYCFYVQQLCPVAGNTSALVGPVCFTTTAAVGCPVPTAVTTGAVTATTAALRWTPGGAPLIGTTYDVEYGAAGFTLGTGTVVAGLSGPATTLGGLTPATSYCYYVRQVCPAPVGGSSAWVGPECFTTGTVPPVPANDEPCGATVLPISPNTQPLIVINGTNVGATTSTQPGVGGAGCSPATALQDVWFTVDYAGGLLRFVVTGAAAGMVRIFSAPDCAAGPFTLVHCEGSGAANTVVAPFSVPNLIPGQRYYVAVSGYATGDTPGTFGLSFYDVMLGTRHTLAADVLHLFPNPSHGAPLTMRLSSLPTHGTAVLLNALGQEVLHTAVPAGSSEQRLPTEKLAAGLYTLRIVAGAGVVSRKVVLD